MVNGDTGVRIRIRIRNGAVVQQSAPGGIAMGQAGGVALGAGSVASTAAGAAGYVPPTATDSQRIAIGNTTSTLSADASRCATIDGSEVIPMPHATSGLRNAPGASGKALRGRLPRAIGPR